MSGATPLAITDCLNYGNPQNPEVMWQFAQGCEGIKQACVALNTPVVSGNVSLYNETGGVSIQPTPAIVCVGTNEGEVIPSDFCASDVSVYLVGDTKGVFAGSLYMKAVENRVAGSLPELSLKAERALWDFAIEAGRSGVLEFANSVGIGGVAITLAKMACVGGIGGEFEMSCDDSRDIFDESFSRAIFGVRDEAKFKELAAKYGLSLMRLGISGGEVFRINSVRKNINALKEIYFGEFAKIVKSED